MTSYTELLILYDLILIAIVFTYQAGKVLVLWGAQIRASRGGQAVGDVVDKAAEKAKKAQEKVAAKAKKAQAKLDALQNKIRTEVADGLGAAEDTVRPEED